MHWSQILVAAAGLLGTGFKLGHTPALPTPTIERLVIVEQVIQYVPITSLVHETHTKTVGIVATPVTAIPTFLPDEPATAAPHATPILFNDYASSPYKPANMTNVNLDLYVKVYAAALAFVDPQVSYAQIVAFCAIVYALYSIVYFINEQFFVYLRVHTYQGYSVPYGRWECQECKHGGLVFTQQNRLLVYTALRKIGFGVKYWTLTWIRIVGNLATMLPRAADLCDAIVSFTVWLVGQFAGFVAASVTSDLAKTLWVKVRILGLHLWPATYLDRISIRYSQWKKETYDVYEKITLANLTLQDRIQLKEALFLARKELLDFNEHYVVSLAERCKNYRHSLLFTLAENKWLRQLAVDVANDDYWRAKKAMPSIAAQNAWPPYSAITFGFMPAAADGLHLLPMEGERKRGAKGYEAHFPTKEADRFKPDSYKHLPVPDLFKDKPFGFNVEFKQRESAGLTGWTVITSRQDLQNKFTIGGGNQVLPEDIAADGNGYARWKETNCIW